MQGAVVEALTTWRRDGTPHQPGRLADHRRPAQRARPAAVPRPPQRLVDALADPPADEPGRRATSGRRGRTARRCSSRCCHPALAPEARLALTLRAVIGLTTPQIARAFLVNEQTLAQRIVRAKRKIVAAASSSRCPRISTSGSPTSSPSSTSPTTRRSSPPRPHPRPRPRSRRGLARRGRRPSLPDAGRGVGPGRLLPSSTAAPPPGSPTGDLVLLRDQDRSPGTSPPSSAPESTSSAPRRSAPPAATSSRPRSPCVTPRRRPGRRPTGCRSSRSTASCPPGPVPGGPPQRRDRARPARSRGRPPCARRRRGARAPSSAATTSGTPPGPSCCG